MKKISLFILLLTLFGLQSCEDDIVGESDTIEIYQEPTVTYNSSVSGIVTDEEGQALENVSVVYNNETYTTDLNGYFKIANVTAGEDGGILKFSYPDHFDNYKYFIPALNREGFMRVHMVDRELSGTVSGSNGGELTFDGEAKIIFPDAAFVDENNVSYEGEVSVYAHWFDPASSNFSPSMPGDLRAIQADGELAQLGTFGMMAVELESANGQKLQIADNKKATLEFPVPNQLMNAAPDVIETWSLDEDLVYWIEEDVANLVNGKYIAEVSHFSFWNCDAPFPLVNISGKVVDQNGNPLKGVRICITAFGGMQTGYGWTDAEGGFYGKVPKNSELVIQIKDECGNVVFEEQVGPFSSNTSFGEIVVNLTDKVTVSGRLVCSGMGISSGYARITINQFVYYIAEVDDEGYFEQPIIQCEVEKIEIQGFDLENARVSEVITVTNASGNILDVGELEVCDELDEYIIFKIDGSNEVLIENPSAYIRDDNLDVWGSGSNSSISFSFDNMVVGTSNDARRINAFIRGTDPNEFFQFNCNEDQNACENSSLEITALGIEGEYIIGSFMSEAENGQNSVMGEFRIRIDEICTTVSISGKVWLDLDKDGIRQANEPGISQIWLQLIGEQDSLNFQNTTTDADGNYTLGGVCPGEVYLFAEVPNLYAYTLQDQGNDDTVDSDFSPNGFQVNLTQDLENVDLGLTYNGTFDCFVEPISYPSCTEPEGGAVIIELIGAPPYDVIISINGVPQTYSGVNNTLTLDGLVDGVYVVDATDSFGTTCTSEFILDRRDDLFCQVVTTDADCGSPNGTAFVEVEGDPAEYTFLWSNGATTQLVTDLTEGDYAVTTTNANGCEAVCEGFVFGGELGVFIDAELIECENGMVTTMLIANVWGTNGNVDFNWSNGQNGQTITVQDSGGEVYFVSVSDFGGCFAEAEYVTEFPLTQLGGRVWIENDTGTSDVFDQGLESGRDSLIVELYSAGNLVDPISTTATVDDGFYEFRFLATGDYVVRVIPAADLQFVNKDAGMDDGIDSDFDPMTGFTDVITIDGCEPNYSIYAGFNEN